ncbi:hypothetical protein PLICRDRAFT_177476 [Plicaturopsis crispa FD-325 SS-3]|nr:hypothetical protein PLICRDRAFT_177476 [Plicaturopsis crispa FD-325 SS-3]
MFPATFLSFVLLATCVSTTPVLVPHLSPVISVRANINASNTPSINIVAADQARAASLILAGRASVLDKRGKKASTSKSNSTMHAVSASNAAVTYTTTIGIGSPATQYTLLIDTGSSNTWIGADSSHGYTQTSSSKNSGNSVSVTYGSGSFSGTQYTDTVTIGSGLTIKSQSFGVASSSTGTSGVDGILGIGPVGLTSGSLGGSSATVPTVTDSLFSQGSIPSNQIGVYFAPQASSDSSGSMMFGGVDSTKYTGSITYAPITSKSPSSAYWGVDASISYGSTTFVKSSAGIVDTGTTMTLIPSDAFALYKQKTGAVVDSTTGLLTITAAQYAKLKDFNFVIGGKKHALTPNAQLWPRSLNTALGGSASSIYLIIADIGHNSGSGFDWIAGYTFLERHYSVFDTANKRVGLATTAHTSDTSN